MTNAEKNYNKMIKTPVSKLIVTLGIPTTISMLITNIYNMADTYFVGELGTSQQAACGILFTLQCIIQAIAFMLGHGSGAFVSKALADKDIDQASKYSSTAFYVGLISSLLLAILGLIFLEPFMYLLGSSDTVLPYAKEYGFWVLLSCPFLVCSLIINNNLRYEGKAVFAMIGLVSGGLLNILGDYIFTVIIPLGVFGAGMSTAISQFISFIILLVLYIKTAQSKITIKKISKKLKDYLDIFRVGLPSLFRQGLTSISSGILNNLVKPFGDVATAAISIINRFSSLVMCVGLGIGQGYQPVASFNYQAKEYTRVKKGLVFTIIFGLCFVSVLALSGIIFAKEIVTFFQKDPEVIKIGVTGLRIASFGVIFMAISVPVNMLYQSIRKSGIASFLSLLRSGLAFIPTLLILSSLFNLDGILWAQPIADIISSLICVPFILHFLIKHPNTEKKMEG